MMERIDEGSSILNGAEKSIPLMSDGGERALCTSVTGGTVRGAGPTGFNSEPFMASSRSAQRSQPRVRSDE